MENIVKMIVKKYGGYREKEIMRHSHTMPDADGYFPGFQVDIITMSICG